jgi:hypothetical protein
VICSGMSSCFQSSDISSTSLNATLFWFLAVLTWLALVELSEHHQLGISDCLNDHEM